MKEIKDLGFGIIQVNEPKPTMSKMESVDNYLCKWQKLKEWLEEKIKEYEPTYDEWMALNYDFYNKTNIQSVYKNILDKMQELEKGGNNEN